MTSYLLALNCGSSSFKFQVFSYPDLKLVAKGQASGLTSSAKLSLSYVDSDSDPVNKDLPDVAKASSPHSDAFAAVVGALEGQGGLLKSKDQIKVVTHRVVHGGEHDKSAIVTEQEQSALESVERISAFAPLHNHGAVMVIRAALKHLGGRKDPCKHVLVFDTTFHRSIPSHISSYPIAPPDHETRVPIRRYGFHGISYQSILQNVATHLSLPESSCSLIVCHLGSGASMCAIRDGRSLDTSMGLSPLEGLPGGTRCGSVDPTVPFHLLRGAQDQVEISGGGKITRAEKVFNTESGFKGLTGTAEYGDIVGKAKDGDGKCKLAVDLFEDRILNFLGAYLLKLGGPANIDALVYSGGIGEKSAELRSSISSKLAWLGVELDPKRNEAASGKDAGTVEEIGTSKGAKMKVLRVLTDEEGVCAQIAEDMLGDRP